MKRMCKFIFGIIFSIFMMGIISCSGQDESTNLTIAIDMSGLLPSNESKDSFARSVDDEKWKLKVTLIDLEDENNIIPPISVPIIDDKASVTFEKIPLFFKGRIEAIIFEGETAIYTGRSEEFTVHEGRNRILLTLKEVDNPGDDPTEPGNPEDPADPNDQNQPGDGTGEGSGDTGGDNPKEPDDPTEPSDPEDPADPNDPNQPGDGTGDDSGETGGDDPEIGDTEKTANYTVEHWQQNAEDDEYTLVETDTENKTGIVGAETSAEAKNYAGFEEGVVKQETIAEDGSTVVKIKYNRKVITLTFDTTGGSDVNEIEGKYGAKITDSIVTTKTGYIFDAWDPELPETFPATDTTFIAQWTPITYTVVFDPGVEDGSVRETMDSLPCTYNVPNVLPKNEFTRKNFDFDGWKDAYGTEYKDCASVENLASTQNAVVTLYAQWHPQSKVRDVEFSVGGGDVNYGTKVTLRCETAGATIYYKEGNAEVFSEYNGEIEIKNDVTITAYATKEGMVDSEQITKTYTLKKYTVTLKYNNETEETTVEVTSGSQYTLPTEVTRTGYAFGGWELNDEIVNTVKVTNADIELTAKWIPITYTVVFNANGGDGLPSEQSQNFTYDESQNLNENVFTRDGYTFVRWNTKEDGSGTFYADKAEVSNLSSTQGARVILYAQWKKIESSITIKFNEYSDIPFDIKTEGSFIFVENFDTGNYSIFAWEKDGVTIEGSENQSSIDVSEWNGGIYTVTIIFKDTDNNLYSKEMQVTINKVNSAN